MLTQLTEPFVPLPFKDEIGVITDKVVEHDEFDGMEIDRLASSCYRTITPDHDLSGDIRAYRIRPRRKLWGQRLGPREILENIFRDKIRQLKRLRREPNWVRLKPDIHVGRDRLLYESGGQVYGISILFLADRESTIRLGRWISKEGYEIEFPDSLLRAIQFIYFESKSSKELQRAHDIDGEADYTTGRIHLFNVDKRSLRILRDTFWHEAGHLALDSFQRSKDANRKIVWERLLRPLWILAAYLDARPLVGEYHRYSMGEHFAEAMAAYMGQPDDFRRSHPHRTAVIGLLVNNVFEEAAQKLRYAF